MATLSSATEINEEVILSRPLQLEDNANGGNRSPSIGELLLNLFKNVRPGSNLTSFQIPAVFNLPKSQLQCYGESVYCLRENMLGICNDAVTPAERFSAVVGWSLSNLRPLSFGLAPYNPLLGETHHVSNGSLNVLIEQVSHHPPITALHATDESQLIEMIWCQQATPKFHSSGVEVEVKGKKILKLLKHGETYTFQSPNLSIKFFPPKVDWVGDVRIHCPESGLEAELHHSTSSFFVRRSRSHAVSGRIYQKSSSATIALLHGHWNSIVMVKEVSSGREKVIYNAKEAIIKLRTPVVREKEKVWATESAKMWSKVSKSIISKEWDHAREAKTALETRQRIIAKEMALKEEQWVPKYFSLYFNVEEGWGCTPRLKSVPPAPIIVPLGEDHLLAS